MVAAVSPIPEGEIHSLSRFFSSKAIYELGVEVAFRPQVEQPRAVAPGGVISSRVKTLGWFPGAKALIGG